MVVVLSDLFDNVPAMLAGLKHFRHRRHEVIVFHVLDAAELDFPFTHTTLFKGLEKFPELLTDPRTLRKAYLQEFGSFLHDVQQGCREQQIDYVQLRTDRPLDVALSAYLASRMTKNVGQRTKDEGRRTKDEGRRTKDEGRRTKQGSARIRVANRV